MKKIFLLVTASITVTFANVDGTTIYNNKCKVCHSLSKPKDMNNMKAPPFSKVSARLKFMLKDRAKFIAFVKDYIQNPDAKKSLCMPMAVKVFGVMPPIGKSLTKEELNTISNWLYDNFKTKWTMPKNGMMGKCQADMKNK